MKLKPIPQKYKYIMFDFDGTLCNTSPGVFATLKKVFSHFGVDPNSIDLSTCIGPPLSESFTRYISAEKMSDAVKLYNQILVEDQAMKDSFVYRGMEETLFRLKERKFILAIASNKPQNQLEDSVKMHGLDQVFSVVQGAVDNNSNKVQTIEKLCQSNNWNKSQCLLVGDTIYDALGARDAKVDFLAVTYGFGNRDQMQPYAVAFAETPHQICTLLRHPAE